MAKYTVELLDHKVERQLDRIPAAEFGRVRDAVSSLQDNPRPPGCLRLHGMEAWRIRVGDWRVIYHIDDAEQTVTVVEVRRRREDTYR